MFDQEIYGCGAPPYDIKVGMCQQLMRHCKSGPLEPWMSENCGETCEPPVQRWLGFGFAFSTPGGFDLNKPKDQKMLGDGFAVGISEVLGVSNTTVQVSPGEAKVEDPLLIQLIVWDALLWPVAARGLGVGPVGAVPHWRLCCFAARSRPCSAGYARAVSRSWKCCPTGSMEKV